MTEDKLVRAVVWARGLSLLSMLAVGAALVAGGHRGPLVADVRADNTSVANPHGGLADLDPPANGDMRTLVGRLIAAD
jgi:hypothetical protein